MNARTPPSARTFDCVVCGSCVADILVRPVSLNTAIGGGRLFPVEPIEITTGGIALNAGIAPSRLGMRAAVFSYVGHDSWGSVIRERLQAEGIDVGRLTTHPTAPTSTTVAPDRSQWRAELRPLRRSP